MFLRFNTDCVPKAECTAKGAEIKAALYEECSTTQSNESVEKLFSAIQLMLLKAAGVPITIQANSANDEIIKQKRMARERTAIDRPVKHQ